jgi:hypothetical protein
MRECVLRGAMQPMCECGAVIGSRAKRCAECRRRVQSERYRERHNQELRMKAIRRYYRRLGRPVPEKPRVIRYGVERTGCVVDGTR